MSNSSTTFTEASGTTSTPVVVDSALTVSDSDNLTLASATVAITGNFVSGQDTLAFTNDNATMGNISPSYNALTGEYGDMVGYGVIDPVKVTRYALSNAASIAGVILGNRWFR